MQQTLKRFMIPALVAMVTLLTGVAAVGNIRAHTYKPFNEPLFFPSALVGSAADGLNATPIPVNRVSPAIHAATTFTLEVRGNSSFFPPSVTIAPGDTVVWLRVSGTHNVADDDGSFRLGEGAATLLPTAISTTVPPGSNKLYLPLVTQS